MWMCEPFHEGLWPQPLSLDVTVTQELGLLSKFRTQQVCDIGMMVYSSAHPQHVNVLKHLERMLEQFHEGLGSQPMHPDTNYRTAVNQELGLHSFILHFRTNMYVVLVA
jgi:hypothetical protein